MANFNDSLKVILRNEGGYNCAFIGSGETYKGIDRNYSSDWIGWQIIDNLKASGKLDARCLKRGEQYIRSSYLDSLVNGWYNTELMPYFGNNFSSIKNQTVANFLADFVWHKPYRAIYITNVITKGLTHLRSDEINVNYITPQAIAVINNNSTEFYKQLVKYRLAYYNNPRSINTNWDERFTTSLQGLINRVNRFPKQLSWWSWLF